MNKAEQSAARDRLRETFKPGDTVHTVLRHVSRSGMSRSISVIDKGHNDISYLVARALDMRIDQNNGGVKVTGCGMDMGFHLVYNLSYVLNKDGFGCIGEGCPSNDHHNGDRDYTPHMNEKDRIGADGKLCNCHATHWHKDGGYALRHRWI
jgi:hypothetical protein